MPPPTPSRARTTTPQPTARTNSPPPPPTHEPPPRRAGSDLVRLVYDTAPTAHTRMPTPELLGRLAALLAARRSRRQRWRRELDEGFVTKWNPSVEEEARFWERFGRADGREEEVCAGGRAVVVACRDWGGGGFEAWWLVM